MYRLLGFDTPAITELNNLSLSDISEPSPALTANGFIPIVVAPTDGSVGAYGIIDI